MKNKTGLTKYEKETIINFNQEDDFASVYTCDEAWIRKLDKIMKTDLRITLETKDEYSKTYNIPKNAVKVRLSRVLSSEERKKLILRAKTSFKKQ